MNVEFQATEWVDHNEEINGENIDEDYIEDKEYIIQTFGVTSKGESVCCSIRNFTPFFYVKVPENWSSREVKIFINNLFSTKGYYNGRPYYPLSKYKKYILKNKCVLQNKKDFFGFSGNKLFKFLRLTFRNSEAMKRCIYMIKNHNDNSHKSVIKNAPKQLKLYEINLDNILRFLHIRNLKPSGWIRTENATSNHDKKSRCKIDINVEWTNVFPVDTIKNAPILQASFDIETYSHDGSFPSPANPKHCIFQIATAFKRLGSDKFHLKHIICLKQCSPLDNNDVKTVMECYDNESDVIMAWAKLISKTDPDILYTYNGDQFDGKYLAVRAKYLGIENSFMDQLSRLRTEPAKLNKNEFSSSAYGSSVYYRLAMPGRINFDILIYIRREYKESSYKLDVIAEKFIGENKNPVTPQMMFEAFREGNPDKLKEVAEYCIVDTLLPQRLCDKMHILQNQISMSNVTHVPIKYLIEQGQQVKVFSQILKETRKENFLVPYINSYGKASSESFTGATVLPPMSGAYFSPITVCDFASLYPSIMRAHNLCYSTIVLDDKLYGNLENTEYSTFDWEDVDEKTKTVTKHSFKYVQSSGGILPKLLAELTVARSNYKKLMAKATDPFEKEIYNKSQLAVKVSMNSMYGFLAAHKLQCKPIAATVTAIGRGMIKDTKDFMEKKYNSSVAVYGDSVTGDTPIIVRNSDSGVVQLKTIDSLCSTDMWMSYQEFKPLDTIKSNRRDKEQACINYEVWSDKGWNPIRRVIRHRCNKTIYRIMTGDGIVDVTEDHSLLNENFEKIKPRDVNKGDRLLHVSTLPDMIISNMDYVKSCGKLRQQYNYIMSSHGSSQDDVKIEQIIKLRDTEEYVYDLETDIGRFHAGIGKLMLANTDSVFVKFKTDSLTRYESERDRINNQVVVTDRDKQYLKDLNKICIKESMESGKEAAIAATEHLFKYPIKLEYEKVYSPLLLLSKKRYIGRLYDNDHEKISKIDNKGVVLTRRDNFQLLKTTYQKVIDILLEEGDLGKDKAIEYIKGILKDIQDNKIDISQVITSKSLKSSYKNQNIPHVVLSRKLEERDPGNKPKSNDRIPYIFIDTGEVKAQAQYKKVEDPEYAKEHNLHIDTEYYIKFLMKPLCEILQLFVESPEKIFLNAIKEYKEERIKKLKK